MLTTVKAPPRTQASDIRDARSLPCFLSIVTLFNTASTRSKKYASAKSEEILSSANDIRLGLRMFRFGINNDAIKTYQKPHQPQGLVNIKSRVTDDSKRQSLSLFRMTNVTLRWSDSGNHDQQRYISLGSRISGVNLSYNCLLRFREYLPFGLSAAPSLISTPWNLQDVTLAVGLGDIRPLHIYRKIEIFPIQHTNASQSITSPVPFVSSTSSSFTRFLAWSNTALSTYTSSNHILNPHQ